MTLIGMQRKYNKHSAADEYWFAFPRRGKVYFIKLRHIPRKYMRLTHAASSRGGYAKIKLYISSAECDEAIQKGKAIYLCEESELDSDLGHNRGENVERIITETYTTQTWIKDSVPFWIAGDIEINGKQIQIKFIGAELTNESTLQKNFGLAA